MGTRILGAEWSTEWQTGPLRMDQMSPRIIGMLENPECILLALELLLPLDLKGCEALFPITIGTPSHGCALLALIHSSNLTGKEKILSLVQR